VGFCAFHEGRGARKTDTQEGRIIVSGKRIVSEKQKLREKKGFRRGKIADSCLSEG
jgi:hypothetical protein